MLQENVRKIALLFSGGVESTCLLYLYLKEGWLVYPLYVKAGFYWEPFELEKAREIWHITKKKYKRLMPLRIVSIPRTETPKGRDTKRDLFIPLRNINLVLATANYATTKGIRDIAIGSLGIYPFFDNNQEYFKSLEKLIGIHIHTPFMGMEKHEVIAKFSKDVPLDKSFSCINPKRKGKEILPCGICAKCQEREEAFKFLSFHPLVNS